MLHWPPGLGKALHQKFRALLIAATVLLHVFLAIIEGGGGAELGRAKDAVVEVSLDGGQVRDQVGVADAEADPPARHGIALRDGEELHRHLARPRDLEDAARGECRIERQIRVRQIGDHPQLLPPRQRHYLLVVGQVDSGGGGVVREVHDQPHRGPRRCRQRPFQRR